MSVSAIIVMILGMLLLWGGLVVSIWHAIRAGKRKA